jgi:hypothetical protein
MRIGFGRIGTEEWLGSATTYHELKGLKKNATFKVGPDFYIWSASVAAS